MKAISFEKSKKQIPAWFDQRYGDHYAQMSTRSTLKLKSSAKDVARAVRGFVPQEIEEWTKKFEIPPMGISDLDFILGYETAEGHEQGSIERDAALQAYIEKYPDDWEIVQKLLGQNRNAGRHACFPKDELIKTVDGIKAIQDCDGEEVWTGQECKTAKAKLICQGMKEVMEYTLSNGKVIRCTPDHLLLTEKGWVEANMVFLLGLELKEPL